MGKFLAVFLVLSAVLAGGGMYYLQEYHFYEEVQGAEFETVELTGLVSGAPESIRIENFEGIDADSSPLRYRACFTTPMSQALLTETYEIYEDAVPLNAPGWFECFDAATIGEGLETGDMIAFLGTANVIYGFDRVVAVDAAGNGFVWHQLNHCGEMVFDGKPVPEGCPPPPERTE